MTEPGFGALVIEGLVRLVGALLSPFSGPSERTFWPFLGSAALISIGIELRRRHGRGIAALIHAALGLGLWAHRSSRLDLQLVLARVLMEFIGLLPKLGGGAALAALWVRALDAWFGRPAPATSPEWLRTLAYGLCLFVAWDFSRFIIHFLLHRIPVLWQFHQVHHSAEVLTPLTFHRVHPVESLISQARGALVTGTLAGIHFWLYRGEAAALTILGVEALGICFNAATGNLRHSHVWLGFGPRLEGWLLSPAQHQLHHSADRQDQRSNFGTWLACWDRLLGTLRLSGPRPPAQMGLGDAPRNHEDNLYAALVGPFVGAARTLAPKRGYLLGLLATLALPATGDAATPEDSPPADPEPEDEHEAAGEILVVAPRRLPRVAGSAHKVSQEELERKESDDIHQVLAEVPGVYTRNEDGFGLRPNIGMRGGNSDRSARIMLMEDGLPLAPAPYAAPAAYTFPLATRLVGVEIYKGPAAILFGPQTIGGALNLLTREIPEEPSAEIDLGAGSWSTEKIHGWASAGGERWGLLLEAAHLGSDGFKQLDGGGNTGFERQDLMLKAKVGAPGPEPWSEVSLKLGYGREHSNETYLGLSLEDFARTPYRRYAASALDQMDWHREQASLGWAVDAGQLELNSALYYQGLQRSWTKLNAFADGPDLHDLLLNPDGGQAAVYAAILRGDEDSVSADQALALGTNNRRYRQAGLQVVARHRGGGERLSHQLELGGRVHGEKVQRRHTEQDWWMNAGVLVPNDPTVRTTLDSDTDALALSAWMHEDLRLGRFHVLPGLRLEQIRTSARDATPGAEPTSSAPIWRPILLPGIGLSVGQEPGWQVFSGLHRGFSPVPPGEPAEASPELAWTLEAGGRLDPGWLRVEAVGFYSDYDNLAGQCTLSGGCTDELLDQQFSGGEARVWGLESMVDLELPLVRGLTLVPGLSYTFTESEFLTGFSSSFPQWDSVAVGDALPYVPVHQGAASLVLQGRRASIGLHGTGRGAMRDVAGQGEIPVESKLPGAVLLDLSADAWITDRARCYLTVTNLTDAVVLSSLRPYGARPGAPLHLSLGIKAGLPRPAL